MNIRVIPGSIAIEGIQGEIHDDGFILFVSTREKYAGAMCPYEGDGETVVLLYPEERTLRHGEQLPAGEDEPTQILLPGGYACEASSGRYTVRVVGVKRSASSADIPWTVYEPSNEVDDAG